MAPLNICMVGTGEYTTGFVGGGASGSDKKVGVVGLTLFDLRRRGLVGQLSMVGISGSKFPAIREHLQKNITNAYNNLDTSFTSYPANDQRDPEAYKTAIDALSPGDAITIFTPDPTHYPIALYAIRKGIHVMITNPPSKPFRNINISSPKPVAATSSSTSSTTNVSTRPTPTRGTAPPTAVWATSTISTRTCRNPKSQLETFKAWAGKDSDISYYLNSHHIDVCESMVPEWRPVRVMGSASTGIATDLGCVAETEDTITLLVDWERKDGSGRRATGVYTASWTAPQRAGVHSNQYFHYMGSKGEVRVDQAKRGYAVTEDEGGLTWYNPFYMKYAPDEEGNFAGQGGYGYVSFEKFVSACQALREGRVTLDDLDRRGLPTLKNTIATGAILEAGRITLDQRRPVDIVEKDGEWSLK